MKHIFMINPRAGRKEFATLLRETLERIDGLDYNIFNIRYPGHEKVLVDKVMHFFQEEKMRIYCCGGSGTIAKIIDAIEDLSKVEIAFFPCGLTNDFLKVFGDEQSCFMEIENLIRGKAIDIDYIQTNQGRALNFMSVGFDSLHVKYSKSYYGLSLINQNLPYVMATFHAIFFAKPQEYIVYLDGEKYEGKMSEVFFGNGHVFGGNVRMSEESDVRDGKANIVLGPNRRGLGILKLVVSLMKQKKEELEKQCVIGKYRSMRISRVDGKPFAMNLDGELQEEQEEWEAVIVPQGLQFVIPHGVDMD